MAAAMTGSIAALVLAVAIAAGLVFMARHKRGRRACRHEYPDGWGGGGAAERERWGQGTGPPDRPPAPGGARAPPGPPGDRRGAHLFSNIPGRPSRTTPLPRSAASAPSTSAWTVSSCGRWGGEPARGDRTCWPSCPHGILSVVPAAGLADYGRLASRLRRDARLQGPQGRQGSCGDAAGDIVSTWLRHVLRWVLLAVAIAAGTAVALTLIAAGTDLALRLLP